MNRGAWRAIARGVAKSQTQLSTCPLHTNLQFSIENVQAREIKRSGMHYSLNGKRSTKSSNALPSYPTPWSRKGSYLLHLPVKLVIWLLEDRHRNLSNVPDMRSYPSVNKWRCTSFVQGVGLGGAAFSVLLNLWYEDINCELHVNSTTLCLLPAL